MTSITITPDTAKKRLRFSGDCIAAGEHVGVTVEGFADKIVGGKLRLRVMLGKRTIAKFPLAMANPEAVPPVAGDQWTNPEGTTDAYCELNLNTVPAQKYLRCGMECWIVLDDVDVPQKYGAGDLFIGPWCKERGEDTPYDLDEYPDIVAGMKEEIEEFRMTVGEAKTAAESAVTAATTASEAAQTSANAAATAQNAVSRAETSAEAARNDADAAVEAISRTPRVDETTHRWMVWDAESGEFKDTGVSATGPKGDPGEDADVDGKLPVRPLPKYLHALSFDDPYKADAEAWYESLAPEAMGGACSAVRRGGKLWRNYDWTFDDAAEFVVRMSAAEGRHASVGVASLGAALTEDEVMSGVYTAKYRALPGMTLDGINDAGVVCEINVDGGPKTGWHGDAEDEGIHILAAVRWVLDNADSAASAAEWLADHIIQPQGEMNFHFMVADAEKTYIVENGYSHDVTSGVKVLTNYGVFDTAQAGGGKERYQLLAGGADISAVHWTKAYKSGNTWHSDFESEAQHAAAIEQWAAQGADKEAHRGKTTESGQPWWQSVHTAEYDFAAKTMRVAVQESGEWFTFAAGAKAEVAWGDVADKPETFPPSAHAHDRIADANGNEIAADGTVTKTVTYDDWTPSHSPIPENPQVGDEYFANPVYSGGKWCCQPFVYFASGWSGGPTAAAFMYDDDHEFVYDENPDWLHFPDGTKTYRERIVTDTLALSSQLAGKVDAVAGKGLSANDYTDADKAEVAKVKDKADEFGKWEVAVPYESMRVMWNATNSWWDLLSDDILVDWKVAPYDAVSITFDGTSAGEITATRKRILRTGEALTPGLSEQGVPTDMNVRDLFSESNTSLKGVIAAKTATVATSATAPTSVTLADNDCKTVTMGTATALQIDFGAAKQTGALRLCELVIADAPSTALTLSFPSGHTFHSSMASGKWYTTETGRNHFFFEETATNVWTVTRQVETSDTPTTTHTEGGAE